MQIVQMDNVRRKLFDLCDQLMSCKKGVTAVTAGIKPQNIVNRMLKGCAKIVVIRVRGVGFRLMDGKAGAGKCLHLVTLLPGFLGDLPHNGAGASVCNHIDFNDLHNS